MVADGSDAAPLRRRLFGLLAATACSVACQTAVRFGYVPRLGGPLPAAGLTSLAYAVEVEDRRGLADPLELGRGAAFLFVRPHLRATRDPARVVKEALEAELRSHDLRVGPLESADVVLHVELEQLFLLVTPASRDFVERDSVHAFIEAEVAVRDRASGRSVPAVAIGATEEIVTPFASRRYTLTLNAALARFARRATSHPDVLIGIQTLHPPGATW